MGALRRSWTLVRSSWDILRQDRELLLVPVLSAVACVAGVGSLLAGLMFITEGMWIPETVGLALVLFALALPLSTVAIFATAMVVASATERMEGRDPTLRSAWRVVRSRAGRLLVWAFINSLVAVFLALLSRRGRSGETAAVVGGVAWSYATLLLIPTVLYQDLGLWSCLRHSERTARQAFGVTLAGIGSMGLVFGLAIFVLLQAGVPLFLSGAFLLADLVGVAPAPVMAVAGILLGLAFLSLLVVFAVLQGIFKAALYRYARGEVPPGYTQEALHDVHAWAAPS